MQENAVISGSKLMIASFDLLTASPSGQTPHIPPAARPTKVSAPSGQAVSHDPQPVHCPRSTHIANPPCTHNNASYLQARMQTRQPLHVRSSTSATSSDVTCTLAPPP